MTLGFSPFRNRRKRSICGGNGTEPLHPNRPLAFVFEAYGFGRPIGYAYMIPSYALRVGEVSLLSEGALRALVNLKT